MRDGHDHRQRSFGCFLCLIYVVVRNAEGIMVDDAECLRRYKGAAAIPSVIRGRQVHVDASDSPGKKRVAVYS